jgi:hypothetical protein
MKIVARIRKGPVIHACHVGDLRDIPLGNIAVKHFRILKQALHGHGARRVPVRNIAIERSGVHEDKRQVFHATRIPLLQAATLKRGCAGKHAKHGLGVGHVPIAQIFIKKGCNSPTRTFTFLVVGPVGIEGQVPIGIKDARKIGNQRHVPASHGDSVHDGHGCRLQQHGLIFDMVGMVRNDLIHSINRLVQLLGGGKGSTTNTIVVT